MWLMEIKDSLSKRVIVLFVLGYVSVSWITVFYPNSSSSYSFELVERGLESEEHYQMDTIYSRLHMAQANRI